MAEEAQTEAPQITLTDLQNALRIIDAAAERGAFKGNELTSVGAVRDKLDLFLQATMPEETPEQPEAGGTSAAA
jgi:hypothetical protein